MEKSSCDFRACLSSRSDKPWEREPGFKRHQVRQLLAQVVGGLMQHCKAAGGDLCDALLGGIAKVTALQCPVRARNVADEISEAAGKVPAEITIAGERIPGNWSVRGWTESNSVSRRLARLTRRGGEPAGEDAVGIRHFASSLAVLGEIGVAQNREQAMRLLPSTNEPRCTQALTSVS
jgi:hypothetical protein